MARLTCLKAWSQAAKLSPEKRQHTNKMIVNWSKSLDLNKGESHATNQSSPKPTGQVRRVK